MAVVTVPTRISPLEYRQQVSLDGQVIRMLFKYNKRDAFWYLDLRSADDQPIKLGIKLVTGFALLRLVADFEKRPPGGLTMVDVTGQDREATEQTIGSDSVLLYVEESDLPAGTR